MISSNSILPNASSDLFLTDGGLETTLVFLEGYELPCFAAFDLLRNEKGYNAIKDYYRRYMNIAKNLKTNFILESPTWRANPDWAERIGYPSSALVDVNQKAVQLINEMKNEFENEIPTILISGCVGPQGDGYKPANLMSAEQAEEYHSTQINIFRSTSVNMVSAITMNYVEEAIGITRAAGSANLPVVISFTVETDGKLATGTHLKEAIDQVDKNADQPPLYYMINCAHPTHFLPELVAGKNEAWIKRIKGIRANASCKSHAELDESTELDRGTPSEFAIDHRKMSEMFPHLNVFGGCCGTDDEHVHAIASQLKQLK